MSELDSCRYLKQNALELRGVSPILCITVRKQKFCKCLIGVLPSPSFPGASQSVPLIKSASNASLFMTRKEKKKDIDALGQLFAPDVGSRPLDCKTLQRRFRLKITKSWSKTQYLKRILILPTSTAIIVFARLTGADHLS